MTSVKALSKFKQDYSASWIPFSDSWKIEIEIVKYLTMKAAVWYYHPSQGQQHLEGSFSMCEYILPKWNGPLQHIRRWIILLAEKKLLPSKGMVKP